jgi:hypothetical protein
MYPVTMLQEQNISGSLPRKYNSQLSTNSLHEPLTIFENTDSREDKRDAPRGLPPSKARATLRSQEKLHCPTFCQHCTRGLTTTREYEQRGKRTCCK